MIHSELKLEALRKLRRYAKARDRTVDREVRFVELTDDEAAALVEYVEELEER